MLNRLFTTLNQNHTWPSKSTTLFKAQGLVKSSSSRGGVSLLRISGRIHPFFVIKSSYNAFGFDTNFDPEFQSNHAWQENSLIRSKTANSLISLHSADWHLVPTEFQLSSFPAIYHPKFSVIHDGIDITTASPPTDDCKSFHGLFPRIPRSSPVITFVNRTLEPYRGAHVFIRSIPQLLSQNPDAYSYCWLNTRC